MYGPAPGEPLVTVVVVPDWLDEVVPELLLTMTSSNRGIMLRRASKMVMHLREQQDLGAAEVIGAMNWGTW